MADYGHDPTETAVPFMAFHEAGFDIEFATENGKQPQCDRKMLEGITQKLLGADASALAAHKSMLSLPSIQHPISWSSPSFSLDPYNLLFFPGGHEKGVRQVIDSPVIHTHVANYFPQTLRPSASTNGSSATSTPSTKTIAAVCHGVMVLSESIHPMNQSSAGDKAGKSVLYDTHTTALPAIFERAAYQATRLFLGDYYKTYGAGSEHVEEAVTKRLADKRQFKGYAGLKPFVVEDERYRYVSARWPGDAKLLAERVVGMVRGGEGKVAVKA
ncbi:MAG: hypothetical protein LQ340_008029 [Diploschistes diacapsis]|nr:MAG: hypothetical protein LQ340_008029 [Diploschistes diacapsis]